MSYAAIMVHFDAGPSAHRRLHLAVDLANRFQAALIGISGKSYLPTFVPDGLTAGEGAGSERREMMDIVADIGAEFRASAKHAKDLEWRGRAEHVNDLVSNAARAADLVIIGQESKLDDELHYKLDPGIVILSAGRPVLVVPDDVDSLAAQRIVLAWKDTRESRRAVRDALPFLKEARGVMLAEISERRTESQSRSHLDDAANYLLRHGINVEAQAYLRTESTVAGELLRFAADRKADLIVAGGYGHTRLGEWMFGGVTRDLLAESRICCLFSH